MALQKAGSFAAVGTLQHIAICDLSYSGLTVVLVLTMKQCCLQCGLVAMLVNMSFLL